MAKQIIEILLLPDSLIIVVSLRANK